MNKAIKQATTLIFALLGVLVGSSIYDGSMTTSLVVSVLSIAGVVYITEYTFRGSSANGYTGMAFLFLTGTIIGAAVSDGTTDSIGFPALAVFIMVCLLGFGIDYLKKFISQARA